LLEKVHNEWENYEEPAYVKHEEKWGKSDYYTEALEENPKLKSIKKCVKINVLKNTIVAQNDEQGVSKYRNIEVKIILKVKFFWKIIYYNSLKNSIILPK
jgi:hypothetical protein